MMEGLRPSRCCWDVVCIGACEGVGWVGGVRQVRLR